MGYQWRGGYRGYMFPRRKQWRGRFRKARLNQGETLGYVCRVTREHRSSHLGHNQYRVGGESQDGRTLRCGELKRLPKCEEPTTGSFKTRTKGAQDSVERSRRGRRGGARRRYPRGYRRRRGRGCRSGCWVGYPQGCRRGRGRGCCSECRVYLHLKGATKEMDEVGSEDEGDDYQGGIDDDEDG